MTLPPIVPQFAAQGTVPANASYAKYTLTTALLQLQWAFGFQSGDPNTAALWMDVASDTAGRNLGLPPASQTTPGMALTISNTGTQPVVVQGYTGSALGAVQPTQSVVFVLVDNGTQGGTWRTILLGATTAASNAAQLAGPGLSVVNGQLAVTWPVVPFSVDRAVTTSDRAVVLNFTGGSANLTLPPVASVPAGFLFCVKDSGTGVVTMLPAGTEKIDGTTSVVYAPQQSAFVVSDGAAWITLAGKGAASAAGVSSRSIAVGGAAGNYSLTTSEVAAQIQIMTGVLTGDRKALYGSVPGYWFVQNNTTGAFSLTLAAGATDPGFRIPQGTFAVVASDGINMRGIAQGGGGTITAVNAGAGLTGGGTVGAVTLAVQASGAAGSYGGATRYAATVVVDGVGRVTGATQVGPFMLTTDVQGQYLPLTGGTISGSLTVTGNFNCGNSVWAGGLYVGGIGDASYGLFQDGTNRYFQYQNGGWNWTFVLTSGRLLWNVPNVGQYAFDTDGIFRTPAGFASGGSVNVSGNVIAGATVQAAFLHSTGNLTVDGSAGINVNMQVGQNLTVITGNGYKPGGGSWADTSAQVLKENIKPYTRGLAAIRALRPKDYNFRAETGRDVEHRVIGILAEDIDPVMPETLAYLPGVTRMGEIEVENMPVYDATALPYALVNAVQEIADALERHGIKL